MSVHDDIESIGNTAKNEIILAWFDYLNLKISGKYVYLYYSLMVR